ncbi:uncharacterized protein LDX57_004255 [Aspergillus melleus]|uniref:uncharacterized protein n=1 Tax=Aspergillus melleus TaxID=138277 RepID=UPI001E8D6622|nr:uncharacterized protein LDX57_004255 [Aspergillus melleus]KAH8426520.1 hypothetical protein LDX57_004255 [Aspergillus melleus]
MVDYRYNGGGRSGRQARRPPENYQRAQQSTPYKYYIHVGLNVQGLQERDELREAYSALSYDEDVTICTSSRAVPRGKGVLIEIYIADQPSIRNVKNFALQKLRDGMAGRRGGRDGVRRWPRGTESREFWRLYPNSR